MARTASPISIILRHPLQYTSLSYQNVLKIGFGFISATIAMERCVEMAKAYGVGMASIKHSNHFGMSASFALQAADSNMMSLVFTNSSPAVRLGKFTQYVMPTV